MHDLGAALQMCALLPMSCWTCWLLLQSAGVHKRANSAHSLSKLAWCSSRFRWL